jgi:Cu-Zn family superoxide dismutase
VETHGLEGHATTRIALDVVQGRMMRSQHGLVLGALGLLALAGCAPSGNPVVNDARPMTMAENEYVNEIRVPIVGRSESKTAGTATFKTVGDEVHLILDVENAPPGNLAVHLHEKADCSSTDAKSAGDHWNPTSEKHGRLDSTPHAHQGDIGNIKVGPDGKGRLEFKTRNWTIGGRSDTNVMNHAIVIHAKADDFRSQPSGNAGDRIGCGEIRK